MNYKSKRLVIFRTKLFKGFLEGVFGVGLLVYLSPALALEMTGTFIQGGFSVITIQQNESVFYKGKTYFPSDNGSLVIGFGKDDKAKQSLAVINSNGKKTYHHFTIKTREYDVQRINGLPKNKVTPNKETQKLIWEDIKKAKSARKINREATDYLSGFVWPVDSGIITGIYGSQRILNGHPNRPHLGVDVAAPKGTPLLAPGAGVITLVEDMVLSGHTIMVDHGKGLRSTLIHLDSVSVKKGQKVKKGEQIGTVGMTGRATGPHVHWGMSWFNTRLDPAVVVTNAVLKKGDKLTNQVLKVLE